MTPKKKYIYVCSNYTASTLLRMREDAHARTYPSSTMPLALGPMFFTRGPVFLAFCGVSHTQKNRRK